MRHIEVDEWGHVTCHSLDQVGNNLTKTLQWCATHLEPVWVYNDGSFECPHEHVVGWNPDGHELVDPPWVTGEWEAVA